MKLGKKDENNEGTLRNRKREKELNVDVGRKKIGKEEKDDVCTKKYKKKENYYKSLGQENKAGNAERDKGKVKKRKLIKQENGKKVRNEIKCVGIKDNENNE